MHPTLIEMWTRFAEAIEAMEKPKCPDCGQPLDPQNTVPSVVDLNTGEVADICGDCILADAEDGEVQS